MRPDHPRMRGEDALAVAALPMGIGSPPHARGRPTQYGRRAISCGITPACAGKTARRGGTSAISRDHPRMRGEDRFASSLMWPRRGSPPHARGRLDASRAHIIPGRITPACAGKTRVPGPTGSGGWDHPRMRGEDSRIGRESTSPFGSPPHARGRRSTV